MRAGVKMPLLKGGFIAVDVPNEGDSEDTAERLFEDAARTINSEWHTRNKAGDGWQRWFQPVAYALLGQIIENGFASVFEERIDRCERGRRGPRRSVNPFQRGLLALFAQDLGAVREGDREYFGKRLWYAYRHYVPQPFLLGFLGEVWNDVRMRKASPDQIEDEFEDWVIIERARDPAPDRRGPYRADLEEKVEQARTAIAVFREIGLLPQEPAAARTKRRRTKS